jgi:predicted nucleic acid-binding protein
MNVVLDTSVALAWYLNESFSTAARQWQERILSGTVHALVPALHYQEFANVLRTAVRRGAIDPPLADDIFTLHLDAPLDVVEPPRQTLLATALQFECTVYDGVYIAIAETYECPLLTAERSTTPWVVKLGARAISLSHKPQGAPTNRLTRRSRPGAGARG